MAYTETLFIYKDTYLLCKLLLQYSKNVSRIIRYGAYEIAISKACMALDVVRRINSLFGLLAHRDTYNIRHKAWRMMPYKDRVYCANMTKIKIKNKYK